MKKNHYLEESLAVDIQENDPLLSTLAMGLQFLKHDFWESHVKPMDLFVLL